jgi:hypothetical protein
MKHDLRPLIRFMEHLPKSHDVELTILKCHLLIEELLHKIIEKKAENPHFIDSANLRFIQKMYLARAFTKTGIKPWVWGAVKQLNKTRNKLSHGLSANEIKAEYDSFIRIVESATGVPEDNLVNENFTKFHWAAFKVFGSLSVYVHFDPALLKVPTILTGTTEPGGAVDQGHSGPIEKQ